MNYNNSYGYGYQQYPAAPMNQPSMAYQNYSQAQQANFENTFAWVYGDAGAEAFPVAPGKTVLLMHYNEPILYVKSTDMNGRPMPMEVYELVRRNGGGYSQAPQLTGQQMNMNEYVKKSELEGQVNEIMNRNMASQRAMNNGNMQGQNSYQQMPQANQNWSQGQEVYDGKSGV